MMKKKMTMTKCKQRRFTRIQKHIYYEVLGDDNRNDQVEEEKRRR